MSTAVVTGRMSPQLPISNNPSSLAISRPDVRVRPSPPSVSPSPKQLNTGGVTVLEARVMTTAEEKEKNQILNDYLTAHAQLTILQRLADEDRREIAECNKAMAETFVTIQQGQAEISKLDKGIAADKALIDAGDARIAANKEALVKYKAIIETGNARIEANDKSLARDRAIIEAGKAKIAANQVLLAADKAKLIECSESLAKDKAKLAECNASLTADRAKIEAGKALIAETKAKIAENDKVIAANLALKKENTRNFVKGGLKKVFGLDDLAILNAFYTQNEIDYISVNTSKKCLNIDEVGMKAVVIAFLKAHKNVTTLNLTYFKDEMKGNALTVLLTALPETGIAQIIMGRQLTQDECSVLETIQAKYKEANRKPLTIS